jgi:hypothetical protein
MSLAHDRVARWMQGRAQVSADGEVVLGERRGVALVHKLARAYDWIANQVLVTPYDDIEFGAARSIGRGGTLALHAGQRWCSFILLPLLALVRPELADRLGGEGARDRWSAGSTPGGAGSPTSTTRSPRARSSRSTSPSSPVDDARRAWVRRWLAERGLPALDTGSYYVRAFRAEGAVADHLAPLCRDGIVRLCCKPPADPRAPVGAR